MLYEMLVTISMRIENLRTTVVLVY